MGVDQWFSEEWQEVFAMYSLVVKGFKIDNKNFASL